MRGVYAIALAATVGACGGDPAVPDAPMIDAPGPRCDATAPFKAPVPLANLQSPMNDACARLTADELTIVFCRQNADNTWDLYSSTRTSTTSQFGTPQILGTVNTIYSDLWPSISADALTLYFQSDRITPGTMKDYVAHRANATASFDPPDLETNLADNDQHMYLTASGSALYFASATRPGAGLNDIFRSARMPSGALGTPMAVIGGVDSPVDELTPAVTGDELRIAFCRRVMPTDCDIYIASRSSTADGFGAATPLDGLATAGVEEVPTWYSPDGCHLYVYTNAPGGMGGDDLYMLTRE